MASTGAEAVIRGGKIEISIDINALPIIVSGSCACDGLDGLWKVTDAEAFAKEVCSALNAEAEDGTTRVHTMFDKAFMDAIEQGAEGIEEIDEDAYETEAARLRAEAEERRDFVADRMTTIRDQIRSIVWTTIMGSASDAVRLRYPDADKIAMTTEFVVDLGADSLDYVELAIAIEDGFDIEIDDEAIATIVTVGDLVEYVANV